MYVCMYVACMYCSSGIEYLSSTPAATQYMISELCYIKDRAQAVHTLTFRCVMRHSEDCAAWQFCSSEVVIFLLRIHSPQSSSIWATPIWLIVSHFPPASFCHTACFRSLFDHVTKIFIIAINWLSTRCWLLKMAIVNVSVACLSTKRTLFPWNTVSASKPEHSILSWLFLRIHIAAYSQHVWIVIRSGACCGGRYYDTLQPLDDIDNE